MSQKVVGLAPRDAAPGCIYILYSEGMSQDRGEGKLAFKYGLSRNVANRVQNLNRELRRTPRGRVEGAYGGYRDWVIVAVWDVPNMLQSETELGQFLNSRGSKIYASAARELFRADHDELETALERVSSGCNTQPKIFEWFTDPYNFVNSHYELNDSAVDNYDYEFEIEEIEFDEVEKLRAFEELLEDLDTLAEFFAEGKESGWPYSDKDSELEEPNLS